MITLRPYQSTMIMETRELFAQGIRRVLIQCPSGGGKTIVGCDSVRRAIASGRRVLYVVPSGEILEQTADKLEQLQVRHELLTAGKSPDLYGVGALLAMSQTLARREGAEMFDAWRPDMIVVDEAHKLIDQHYAVLDRWPDAWIIGLSATMCRTDGKPLSRLAKHLVLGPTVQELQAHNWLVPVTTHALPALTGGGGIGAKGAVRAWKALANRRRTMAFCASIKASKELCQAFREAGVYAEHIDGTSSKTQRQGAIGRLRSHQIGVVCNAQLFIEGLDVVEVESVMLATSTPTSSLARYIQMVGRGLRPSPATKKKTLRLLDFSGTSQRHGLIEWDRDWAAQGKLAEPRRLMACQVCYCLHVPTDPCPSCSKTRHKRVITPKDRTTGERPRGPGRKRPGAISPREQRRRADRSTKTPVRMCPPWARPVREVWYAAERSRVAKGYQLPVGGDPATGYSERTALRALQAMTVDEGDQQ